ncbi:fasciclin domain-containing protein [Hymenobacter chitinivorans]|uniref:Putative surface protein with fasciclin (FAS1) repeats n=1 Tax=Hymenobacter chitinivorans DSM 11115 TaxID=1121954 RepID=A0A2M9BP72_9BACT|nr:fasciclin domain-containing protein [Hymenobacter chitinivorans]PJJ59722.1 putative surface protein with fasciclin (FAS1) repeats [Hymenobacter chitinivorans DSM 11115]
MKYSLPSLTAVLFATALTFSGCSKNTEADPSIAGIAVANDDFSVLEDAAIRGGVVEVLSNKNPADPQGNYTVFAPNNAAFARLGLRQATDLQALQTSFLTSTLLYHVTGGTLAGSALQAGSSSASALGPVRRIVNRNGSRYVNGSRIVATDVKASNGTVHVIDKVLLATGADVVQSAVAVSTGKVFVKPDLQYLVYAVVYCGLAGALSEGSPQLTVFAPNDQAFKDLYKQFGITLTEPKDLEKLPNAKETLTKVLLGHVVLGSQGGQFTQFTSELPANATLPTLGGGSLFFGDFNGGLLPVQGEGNGTAQASMTIPDILCTNGVVHIIDRVLLPK